MGKTKNFVQGLTLCTSRGTQNLNRGTNYHRSQRSNRGRIHQARCARRPLTPHNRISLPAPHDLEGLRPGERPPRKEPRLRDKKNGKKSVRLQMCGASPFSSQLRTTSRLPRASSHPKPSTALLHQRPYPTSLDLSHMLTMSPVSTKIKG